MTQQLEVEVRHWLALELADQPDAAEAALVAVFHAMPAPTVPRGFSRRVARAAFGPGRALDAWWMQAATASGVALAGIVAAWAVVRLVLPILADNVVGLVALFAQACLWVIDRVNAGLDLWALIASAGRAIGLAVATPQVSIGLILIELVGAAALFGLHRLLASEREES